ncbi:RNA polymerase subunit sigma-24 [Paenibacillus sp. CAA11]|uniref:RNA polymerase sigma factor n=1 Tax=Paenibacillus sp. CAA11 TaxID=1532905 RepID=UPI000D3B1E0F|nr:RNA polymerase sigma factor [Paenibacillus sp. CAA11]AWB44630.1 RNA polymerase subunit sigma-24 [Paenibacillus sp. CAA11]
MQDEQYWINCCRNGDQNAFYMLVEPLLNKVYSASVAILRSTHQAEDAVQNAMLEAYAAIMKGKEIRNFTSWFKQLVAMRAIDLARKQTRQQQLTENWGCMEPVDEEEQPAEALLRKEEEAILLKQVMSLDFNHRSVILLYYYQDMSIEEIADVLNIKKGTVKSRLHHARLKLLKLNQANPNKKVILHA